jgi:hypothetical protein
MRRRRTSRPQWPLGSVFTDNICATRVDPWYLYEASLKIVGFVLLHKVPKEKTGPRGVLEKIGSLKIFGSLARGIRHVR